MKSFLFALLLIVAVCFQPGCASRPDAGVIVLRQNFLELPFEVTPAGWEIRVQRGDSRQTAFSICGRPDFAIGDNLWIYWNSYSPDKAARAGGFDTLVMTFVEERVSDLRLVNGAALRRHLAASMPGLRLSE